MLAACSRTPRPPVERIAILPVENLTGDASLDWIARAAASIASAEISGAKGIFALPAATVSDAYLAGASRFVHGYFTGKSRDLHFDFEVENAANHKMTRSLDENGGLLEAMNAVAKTLDPSAHVFSTSNQDAVEAWGRGEYERATTIDPDFGEAWLGWAESLAARGDAAGATEVAGRALARRTLRSNLDGYRIKLLAATLEKDPSAQAFALAGIVELDPADASALDSLAQAEMNLRNFGQSAAAYRELLRIDPENASAMNLVGYAEAYAGDLDAAQKAFENYGAQPGEKTNSLDSLGEAYFIHGRFTDAEKYFLEAYQSNAQFMGGEDLLKAAYARWLAGDLHGADGLAARFVDQRRKAHDPLAVWQLAVWDYATGRRDQAIAKLKDAPPQIASRQLALWQESQGATGDLDSLKRAYEQTSPLADGQARTLYAAALIQAGKKAQARSLLKLWPLPGERGGNSFRESLVFPRFIELRKAGG